jgi:hypothetical protein
MRRSKLLLVVACVAVVACTQEMTRREVLLQQERAQERVSGWVRTMNNARIDSLLLFYHQVPELRVLWADGGKSNGFEETEQALRDFYRSIQYMNFAVSEVEVQILAKNAAQATFRHSTDIVGIDNVRRPVSAGQGTLVLFLDPDDNLWKIHTQQLSVNRPSGN